MDNAPPPYCRADLSTPLSPQDALVRQLISFPPRGTPPERGGFVRQRNLLMELEGGAVYHLGLPYRWDAQADQVAALAATIKRHDHACPHREHIASVVAWFVGTQIDLVDMDLSAPSSSTWPLRAEALQRCCTAAAIGESSGHLAARADATEKMLANTATEQLHDFAAGLDPDILALTPLWNGMPWGRYNWFANVPQANRSYRIQAARVCPALVPILCGELGPPTPSAVALLEVIDNGRPLIEAMASLFAVHPATAKHALSMPAVFMNAQRMFTLIRALDWVIPERFPRQLAEWQAFERLVHTTLPKLTNRLAANPINFALLPEVSGRGWDPQHNPLSDLFTDDTAGLVVREFLDTYQNALYADITRNNNTGKVRTQKLCAEAIVTLVAEAGLRRIVEASRSFSALLRDAHNQMSPRQEALLTLLGKRWSNVLEAPMRFEDCLIEPLLTVDSLTKIGSELQNCIGESFSTACARGHAHLFLIRTDPGINLGALHLEFPTNRSGESEIHIKECKGPNNKPICEQASKAVSAFCAWLKTAEPQKRISKLRHRPSLISAHDRQCTTKELHIETTILALQRLRHKSLRFNVLRESVLTQMTTPELGNRHYRKASP